MILRRLARPMLASMFVYDGVDALRNPSGRAEIAKPFLDKAGEMVPLQASPDTLVRVNAGVHVGAGTLLALGKMPRLAALALAGSMVPTTLAGHSFWEHEDPEQRGTQQMHFFKNLSMLGGLLIAAADTGGKPSVGWRARQAGKATTKAGKAAGKAGKVSAKGSRATAKGGRAARKLRSTGDDEG